MAILGVAMSFSNRSQNYDSENSHVTISFNHFVGNDKLKLDSIIYKNDLGQSFTIENFKYYISNIHLKNTNGKDFNLNETFFINEDEETTKQINLKTIPKGEYTSIEFIIGVDSIHNCSGAQSGALDPVNAMFWAWNTGYIFLKLEGKAPASKSPGHVFEFHIGGYKQPNNCIRKVKLEFKNKLIVNDILKNQKINIKVDGLEILKKPTSINFEKLSSVVDHNNATMIADNYSDMFTIID